MTGMAECIERDSAAAFAYNCGAVYVSNRLSDKNAFPAADVAPVRHGFWRAFTNPRYCGLDDSGDPIYRDGVLYYCSECARKTVIKERYCPDCGAKMEETDARK